MSGQVVFCLCAQWCSACRSYRATFDALAQEFPGHRFVWIDIEDASEAVGDYDVETFPTVLIADGPRARFLGPILPGHGNLRRLLQALSDSSAAFPLPVAGAQELHARLGRAVSASSG